MGRPTRVLSLQISLSLTPLVFTPGELAINGYLYIVHRGIAL